MPVGHGTGATSFRRPIRLRPKWLKRHEKSSAGCWMAAAIARETGAQRALEQFVKFSRNVSPGLRHIRHDLSRFSQPFLYTPRPNKAGQRIASCRVIL